jgi:rod shape-determining protein MreB
MGLLGYFNGFGVPDMAADGAPRTRSLARARDRAPRSQAVAIDQRTGEVHAVGVEAKRMLGRTPGMISAIRAAQGTASSPTSTSPSRC